MFRLHRAVSIQCSLFTQFHFHLNTVAAPFCLIPLHCSLYAHNISGRCTFMQRECNVGHQTESTGRVLLFLSSEAASRGIDWFEGRKKNQGNKQKPLLQTVKTWSAPVLGVVSGGWRLGNAKTLFPLIPFPPVLCSPVNTLCYRASIYLSCTLRPIIAPTWDCTQDDVGIFDNTDCENETLFWINKQRSLELSD